MKVKRNDVAKAAGVSGATVSYVLNGTKRVSPEVEKRVLEAAKELNYVPNRIAQTLVGRRSNSIAIMTNDITNVYQVEVIKGLQEAALANDYIVYVFDAFGNIDKYLQHIVSRQVDGLFVVAAPDALPDEKLAELRDSGIKVLADYSRGTFVPGVSYIMSDLKGGVERAINYLYRMGHRKIGYLSGFDDACYYDIRLSAFREAMRKLNLDDTGVECRGWPYSTISEVGETLMRQLLAHRPEVTAVLCTNDMMAIGGMYAAKLMEKKIPEELSVVGIDNIAQSKTCIPKLTTINQDGRTYGKHVFEILLKAIRGGEADKYVIPMELVERDSCAPPRTEGV